MLRRVFLKLCGVVPVVGSPIDAGHHAEAFTVIPFEEKRTPRRIKQLGFSFEVMKKLGMEFPRTKAEAEKYDRAAKEFKLIPGDAVLECVFLVCTQDCTIGRWWHPDGEDASGYRVFSTLGVEMNQVQ